MFKLLVEKMIGIKNKTIEFSLVSCLCLLIASALVGVQSCSNSTKDQTEQDSSKTPSREQYLNEIKRLEIEMHIAKEVNPETAKSAIKAYSEYAMNYPSDTITPDYLFKAAEIAMGIKQYQQANQLYKTITDKYTNYKLKRESLYLQAFLLDNYLNDETKAKTIYLEVISKYPESNYARDSKAAINNLGKSDEELIKEFKKKNGEK